MHIHIASRNQGLQNDRKGIGGEKQTLISPEEQVGEGADHAWLPHIEEERATKYSKRTRAGGEKGEIGRVELDDGKADVHERNLDWR